MAMERYFSQDVLADILRRLPPSSRRRARLVCRHWRDVINKRTNEMQSHAKPLIWNDGVAYVIGDLSPDSKGLYKELWRRTPLTADRRKRLTGEDDRHSYLIGTCNGLLCFCINDERIGGSLTVVNPSTGEMLPVPPLPCASRFVGCNRQESWNAAYSFAYHPTTGKYKVVHVPCSYNRLYDFGTMQVLTLGETTWREVPAPIGGARCNVNAGIISLDGVTHWVKMGGDTRIMSFDLDAECFASAAIKLPWLSDKPSSYHLTEVNGRLGFVSLPNMWVLEQGRWSHRYRLQEVDIPLPHFVFGDCIRTWNGSGFYGHWPKNTPPSGWRIECGGLVQIGYQDHGTLVAEAMGYRTFTYVETIEPLGVYAAN